MCTNIIDNSLKLKTVYVFKKKIINNLPIYYGAIFSQEMKIFFLNFEKSSPYLSLYL